MFRRTDAFYQFKDEAFTLEFTYDGEGDQDDTESKPAATLLKRSNTLLSSLSSAFTPATPSARLQKLRSDVAEATSAYKKAVRAAELSRTIADQQIEAYLSFVHRLSMDRLHVLKKILIDSCALIAQAYPLAIASTYTNDTKVLLESINPTTDLQAVYQLYQVGNGYRPKPILFHDRYHDALDCSFGIDLHRYATIQVQQHDQQPSSIPPPPVLTVMLASMQAKYAQQQQLSSVADRRRLWYLEIPLTVVHRLRQALNEPASTPEAVPTNLLTASDLPTVAAAVRLWFLELEPAVLPYALYEDLRRLYAGGGDAFAGKEDKIKALLTLLSHVPLVNLVVLDALLGHLVQLIRPTDGGSEKGKGKAAGADDEEEVDVYLEKLGLSLGRCAFSLLFFATGTRS